MGCFAEPETCRLDTPGDTAYCVAVGDTLLAYAWAPLAEEATELPLNK
jgi:hypothetical protein